MCLTKHHILQAIKLKDVQEISIRDTHLRLTKSAFLGFF